MKQKRCVEAITLEMVVCLRDMREFQYSNKRLYKEAEQELKKLRVELEQQ